VQLRLKFINVRYSKKVHLLTKCTNNSHLVKKFMFHFYLKNQYDCGTLSYILTTYSTEELPRSISTCLIFINCVTLMK